MDRLERQVSNITLYMYPGACSRVTMTALEEIGLDYEDRTVNLDTGIQKS
jgi:glutathione S-transferase